MLEFLCFIDLARKLFSIFLTNPFRIMQCLSSKLILFLGFLLFQHLRLFAQDVHLPSIMPTVSATVPVSKKLDFNFTSFCVFSVSKQKVWGIEYPSQGRLLLVQPSLIYKFSPKLNVAASWAYIVPNPFTPQSGTVFCPWQQVAFNHKVGNGKINHRLRFEELFKQKEKLNQYYRTGRIRYQIGYQVSLQGKTLEKREFYLNVNHESFLNVTGTYLQPLSENWNYAGIGYVLLNKSKIEIGYMGMSMARNKQLDKINYNSVQVSYLFNFTPANLIDWWYH